jgi:hypothetical protein
VPLTGFQEKVLGLHAAHRSPSVPAPALPALMLPAVMLLGLLLVGPAAAQEPEVLTLAPAERAFPEGFTSITSVRELPDGRTLVVDRGERRLYLLDWATGQVETVGRVGQGPGEYSSLGAIYPLSGGGSLLTEGALGRWHLLEGARIRHTVAHDAALPALLGTELGGGSISGSVLGVSTHRGGGPLRDRYAADSLAVLLVESLTDDGAPTRIDTVAVVAGRGPGFPSTVRRGGPPVRVDPFVTEALVVLIPDGWVAVVDACPYQVRWRAPTRGGAAATWTTGPEVDGCGPPLDDPHRCAAAHGWDFRRAPGPCGPEVLERYTWPDRPPPFLSQLPRGMSAPAAAAAFATPDGRLLVRRLPAPGQVTSETRYDVFDRNGRRSAVLRLPANEAIVGVGPDHLYIISADGLDLQHLRRQGWPGAGRGG